MLKRDFFAETLVRFEAKLGIVERRNARVKAEAGQAKAQAALKAALARKQMSSAAKPASRPAGKGMKPVPSDKRVQFPNLRTMKGATRAAHARSQAKRDSRR